MNPWLVWLIITLFILLSSFFTCSETALFSLGRLDLARLRKSSRASCRLAADLMREPQKLLTTVLMGNELADIFSSALSSWFFYQAFGPAGKWLAYPLMSLLLFLWGDLFPKVVGFKFRQRVACVVAYPLRVSEILLAPLRMILLSVAQIFFRLTKVNVPSHRNVPAEEEIKRLVEEAYHSGALRREERLFILSLFETEETPVSVIMTPRKNIWALPDQEITPELLSRLKEAPYRKIPVYQEDLDHIVGILYVQDLLKTRLQKKTVRLSEITRPAFFVPEKTRVRRLLEEFQNRRLKLALVVNEYGEVSGLVTLEDVLEELFGEIYQEREAKKPPIESLGPGCFRVRGWVQVEDFNRETGADLPAGEFRTMASLVLHLFGELPREGAEVQGYGFRFRVEELRDRRIETVIVERVEGEGTG
ncbi:hemolysin family protein [Thermosulfurimonas sp. F29]|uniref:hemolysin family protein n=1 Tax=Thermosulfurimonas sp. F29 TaxID=2867247 RepID=UPI001C83F9CC|nr:hemolysin family protein [Thermosulfurimonas sp. F29]MBX6424062.1 hemolysin family protein [Thermosulfurimonas sp. F29]